MSFEAMAWAVNQDTDNSGQQLVLLMLANHTNGHTGQCNPSHQRLAYECKMGLSTLKNHLKGLEEKGFIRILHLSKDGVSLPNQYILVGVGQDLTDHGSESDRGVGQNLATKQELKPVNKTGTLKPEEVSDEVWQAFVEHRKAKKSQISRLVLNTIAKQASEAGWTLEAALTEMVSRGWQGFKAEWVKSKTPTAKQETPEERRKRLAFM